MTTTTRTNEPICYGQVIGSGWAQESYETASRDAGRRAKALREAGYRVTVCSMGLQVTGVGLVKMTMVDIRGSGDQMCELPPVKIERL